MMLPYLKPFRDIRSNIDILKERGMLFSDEHYAERCFSRIGYYRLSAYWYPFRDFCVLPAEGGRLVRCDRFVKGTTFDHVLDFYLYDKEIRLMISDALERIEIAMRAFLVEVLGAHGAHAHRDLRSYNAHLAARDAITGELPLDSFLSGLDEAFARSNEEFAKHFRRTYAGHPPIWIAAGGWDWGNLSYTFRYLSDRNMSAICALIHPALEQKTLISWMASLNEVRNACAHHSRMWNKVLTNAPGFQKLGQLPDFDHMRTDRGKIDQQHSARLYGALMAIVFLLKRIHPKTEWHHRFAKLVSEKTLAAEISTASAGFPTGWETTSAWN
ncbi:Abi family protein [Pararhodobacter zhoushanensis]|uniref:Abi family protein n=1 Tax=Pararhodobacter zhoushanensis TaxID=2479545 RepID=A0ABT3GT31_9RHOB|nr:Abi family protein [Pararhodobacter zhoushanensis]MCW1930707.1 Abi family protein [Pararhodobacter zhoushanensis]